MLWQTLPSRWVPYAFKVLHMYPGRMMAPTPIRSPLIPAHPLWERPVTVLYQCPCVSKNSASDVPGAYALGCSCEVPLHVVHKEPGTVQVDAVTPRGTEQFLPHRAAISRSVPCRAAAPRS